MLTIIFTKKGVEIIKMSRRSKFIECYYTLKEAIKEFYFNDIVDVFVLHGHFIRLACGE